MPMMETVTIINKSGKIVSTGKHLVNIFKEAKDAYNDKKNELKAEHHARVKQKTAQKLLQAREETRSQASSHRSHRSRRSHRPRDVDPAGPSRPPLTERNLSQISEGSVASSRRSRSSHHGSRRPTSPTSLRSYRAPYFENADISQPSLVRRHTDIPPGPTASALSRGTLPPPYQSQLSRRSVHRSQSNPDLSTDAHIDMNLAYGPTPHDLQFGPVNETESEAELNANLSKLDNLLLEAHCLQHSATAIITNLQANPEAMAAVALTLAEISNLLMKMSPSILTMLKASSPVVVALLASPQFLIAGGVAIGITVVMFGGYKIIKKIQADNAAKKEANRMDEAMVYDGIEMGSIESWRRGIADVETESIGTSVDGEFITPEAARQKKERIKERRREERELIPAIREESVAGESVRSERTLRRVGSESTLRQRPVPERALSKVAPSESGRSKVARSETGKSERSHKSGTVKGKESVVEKKKKQSALSVIFKKNKDKGKEKERDSESSVSHRPKVLEM